MPSATRGVGRSSRSSSAGATPRRSPSRRRRSSCNARRAAPSRPDTHTSSPASAASRRSALPSATSPKTVTHSVNGPRVVSPPISSQPNASAHANRPRLNAASHGSSIAGSATASVNASGVAPIAARSDRLTASVFQPIDSGSASAKKCRSATSRSVEIARVRPGRGASSAQSSPMPSAARPDRPVRSSARSARIRSSLGSGTARRTPGPGSDCAPRGARSTRRS